MTYHYMIKKPMINSIQMRQDLKRVNLNLENSKKKTPNPNQKVKIKREEERINKMTMTK